MSKIPQGEWNAIAARHARGETIARIAYDYGCTAPAIHYILKRQKERAQPGLARTAAAPDVNGPAPRPPVELRPAAEVRTGEPRRESAPALVPGPFPGPFPRPLPGPLSGPSADARRPEEPRPERIAGPRLEARMPPARGNALAAGFDTELQNQIEESIAVFRANLNAALADRSPLRRAELRAAASELMRMTARTMIVLDRLSAGHERAGAPAPDYPRPAHAR